MAARFDAIARWYGMLELLAFGNALQRCRTTFLPELATARSVLIAGEGNGRFLKALMRSNPGAEATVVDNSRRMIELAKARLGEATSVRWLCGDLITCDLPLTGVDVVVTNFFLDCFDESELGDVIERLGKTLREGCRWVWSDFEIPRRGPTRWAGKAMVGGLYGFFRLTTGISSRRLPDPGPHFGKCGLGLVERRTSWGGLLVSAMYRMEPAP